MATSAVMVRPASRHASRVVQVLAADQAVPKATPTVRAAAIERRHGGMIGSSSIDPAGKAAQTHCPASFPEAAMDDRGPRNPPHSRSATPFSETNRGPKITSVLIHQFGTYRGRGGTIRLQPLYGAVRRIDRRRSRHSGGVTPTHARAHAR